VIKLDEQSRQKLEMMEKDKKSKTKSFLKSINPKFMIIAAGVVLLGMYAVNAKVFTTKQMTIIIAVAVVIILILAYQEMNKLDFLTYDQAAILAEKHLEQRQKLMRDIPQGEILPIYAGKLQKVFGEPNQWTLGYKVIGQSGYEYIFEILIDPRVDGLGVIGVIPKTAGYDPQSRKDVYPTAASGNNSEQQPPTGQYENQ
jgi:hypothetical protein